MAKNMIRRPFPRGGIRTRLPVTIYRRSSDEFSPTEISGLALWLDASSDTLYTTDAGPVVAVASPLDIAGCALWLDGADSSSTGMTLDGSLVETWKDKSNSGNNVTASGGLRPTLTGNALNGRSVLTFGGSQGLTGNLAASITTNAYSVFVVCRISGSVTNGRLLSTAGAGSDFASGSVIPCVSSGATLSAYAGTQGTNPSSVTGFASYGVFAGVLSSNLVTNSAGGMSVAAGAATLSTAVTRLGVGVAAQGGTGFNTCDIAEIILYPTALTTAQRASVEAYLAAKWGISGVHAPATATSDPVGYWGDRSGNGRHAVQATASRRPSVIAPTGGTEMVNGRQALWATGSSASGMTLGNISGAFPNSSGTAFFAYKVSAGTTSTGIDNTYSLAMSLANNVNSTNTDTGEEGLWRTTRLASYNSTALPRTSFGASIYTIRSAADEYSLRSKGAQFFSTGTQNWNAGDSYHLWSDPGGTMTALGGWIGEALFYNRALSVLEVQRVERYLAARWGITLAPQVSNADAQDWINRVYANGGTVSSATAAAVNTFCESIASAGIRDRFFRLNLFAGNSDASLNAVRTPLFRGPSLGGTQYGGTTDTNFNFVAGDYSETSGLKGNGSTKYLDTGLQQASIPSLNSSHLSASFTELESGAAERTIMGVWNGTASEFSVLRREGSGSRTIYQGSFQPATASEETAEAHVIGSRPSSAFISLYRSGSSVATAGFSATPTTTTKTYYIYARNNADSVATTLTAMRLRMYSIGTAIDGANAAAFYSALAAFNSALGRA